MRDKSIEILGLALTSYLRALHWTMFQFFTVFSACGEFFSFLFIRAVDSELAAQPPRFGVCNGCRWLNTYFRSCPGNLTANYLDLHVEKVLSTPFTDLATPPGRWSLWCYFNHAANPAWTQISTISVTLHWNLLHTMIKTLIWGRFLAVSESLL